MEYKNNIVPTLCQAQQNRWKNLLHTQATHKLGIIAPNQRFSTYIGIFADTPQATQLYTCGLLNDIQAQEMYNESEKYRIECLQSIYDNYEESLQPEQIASIIPPTLYEIQPRLLHPVFHDPIIHEYVNIVETVKYASIIHDLNKLNLQQQFLNLEDGQNTDNIFKTDNRLLLDMKAVEMCLHIRNGCEYVPEEYNVHLNKAVDYCCANALSCLKHVPENILTQGATERAKWAHDLFIQLFQVPQAAQQNDRTLVMPHTLETTRNLLSIQPHFEEDWRNYLTNWFDDFMLPYSNSLIQDDLSPKKVTPYIAQQPRKEDGRDRTN